MKTICAGMEIRLVIVIVNREYQAGNTLHCNQHAHCVSENTYEH